MSFRQFQPMASGRKGIGDGVSLSEVQINFGKNQPPWNFVQIEYDTKNVAIRFSEGSEDTGYKVKKGKTLYWYIACSSFLKKELLPKGRYSRIAKNEWTFKKA